MQSTPPLWSCYSMRLKVAICIGFALYAAVSMRASLSMGIVCMVNSSVTTNEKFVQEYGPHEEADRCPSLIEDNSTTLDEYNGNLQWPPTRQTMLFSANYYGSLATMLVSGSMADKFGPKRLLTISIAVMVLLTLAAPSLAQLNYWMYYTSRVLLGMCEGFVIPCTNALGGRWFPPNEKSAMAALYTSGNQIAAGTSGLVGSWLCKLPFLDGWPVIFYLFGSIGLIWLVASALIVSDHPSGNRWIRSEEAEYLQGRVVEKSKTILSSREVYACLLCNFTFSFLVSINQNLLPLYFKEELRLSLSMNGLYTVIPFLTQLIMKNILASAADHLKTSGKMSPTHVVKLFQAFASFGTAFILVCLALFPSCNRPWLAAVFMFFYGIFFAGGICGFFTSLISIAPAYAGTLTSMSMGCGQLASIISTSTVAAITYQGWPHKWLIVFSIGAALQVATGIVFLIYGSGNPADWGRIEKGVEKISKVRSWKYRPDYRPTNFYLKSFLNIWTRKRTVAGLILNVLLFYAIRKFSNVKLGAYKHLLAIFTATDACLVILHVIACPRSILVGTTHGVVTDTIFDDRRITALYISLKSVPFNLLNIHFLYRYWAVRRPHLIQLFSRCRFQLLLVLGTLGTLFAWYLLCLHGTTGQEDSAGRRKIVAEYEIKQGKHIENAWIVFDYWRDDHNDVALIATFLIINVLMTTSIILVSSLASLTFYHIRKTCQMSTTAGRLQKRLLVALCAQASVPSIFVYIPYLVTINIPFWRVDITVIYDIGPQFTTFFPMVDAVVVILLIGDYRRGLMGMIRKRPDQPIIAIEQFTEAT